MKLQAYSIGVGDRFGRQGPAQLAAVQKAQKQGLQIAPVWNKSHREHTIVHTTPAAVRAEADHAVRTGGWQGRYYVDADHIGLHNVDGFLESSDFFTLDVAEAIGQVAPLEAIRRFVDRFDDYIGPLRIDGVDETFEVTRGRLEWFASKYLEAVRRAGCIYRYVEAAKGTDTFVTEVSMDESKETQSPLEMFFILAALAAEGVPVQTLAPKFTGRFNKGVDYVGETQQFAREFEQDLAVIRRAVREFDLPTNLKLSIHSGSDKFSIYPPMRRAIRKYETGLHLKTAGTTWLAELAGLAASGDEGLRIARQVYRGARGRIHELCEPYATVIDIDRNKLPSPDEVDTWTGVDFTAALRNDPACLNYNPHFRQLLHVAYKIAAEMESRFLDALDAHRETIAAEVTENLYERHIKPIFLD